MVGRLIDNNLITVVCVVIQWASLAFLDVFFCKQKTAYDWRISDWSSDVCSSDLLVAVGTVADMVPLDANNRALVGAGLRRLQAGQGSEGLRALIEVSGRSAATLSTADIGFALAPRINAAGRLEDMGIGIECLLTDDATQARELAAILHGINIERLALQAGMQDVAETRLDGIDASHAACLFDPDWHPGVAGLVASRLKERLHRPDRKSTGLKSRH